MHNVPALTGGTNRCTLHIHPEDAARLGLADGTAVRVKGAGEKWSPRPRSRTPYDVGW